MSKKSDFKCFIAYYKDKIIDYLDNYAKECDIEMGSHYENAIGLLEAFQHDTDFIFQVFLDMANEFGSDFLNDDYYDEIFFDDYYDEIQDILNK